MTFTITCPKCGGDKFSGTLGTPGGGIYCSRCGPAELPPSKKWFKSPQRFFLDAPKMPESTCFVLNSDYTEAVTEVERLQRELDTANRTIAHFLGPEGEKYVDRFAAMLAGPVSLEESIRRYSSSESGQRYKTALQRIANCDFDPERHKANDDAMIRIALEALRNEIAPASAHEPPVAPARVRLLDDIYDDGQDHHPPGYIARKGDIVEVRRIGTLYVAHPGVTDRSFAVIGGEYEPASAPPPVPEPHVIKQIEHALQDNPGGISREMADYIRGCISDYRHALTKGNSL